MTQKNPDTDQDLEVFFTAEQAADNRTSDALMAAVLRDAMAAQPLPAGIATAPKARWSWPRDLWDTMGGWAAAGALSACLVLGLSIGYTPPQGLADIAISVLETAGISTDDSEFFTLDDMMAEG